MTNPRVLAALESRGFSFGDVLDVRDPTRPRMEDFAEESAAVLLRSPLYTDLVSTLTGEIERLRATVSRAGVGPAFDRRLFDLRWLRSARVHFELVGLVNRLDFRTSPLPGKPPGCGQTRLIYRLAYRPPARPQTRLPLTVNVIHENRGPSCAAVARRWLAVENEQGSALVEALGKGPLAGLDPAKPDRFEVDVQSLRQNSSGLSMDDHAEYILRGFNVSGGHLVEDTLRNTPDPDLAAQEKELLRRWIARNLSAIDDGSAELPARFLATRAVSVAPRGLSRIANRPFQQLFPREEEAFAGLAYDRMQLASSPSLLVRRLDQMSCVGCHQARTIAGFHLPGEDREGGTFNRLALGISEHLREILGWRFRSLRAAAEGRILPEPVPFAERPAGGAEGAHCRRGSGKDPGWPCDSGFTCQSSTVDGESVGACVREGGRGAGTACQNVSLAATPGPDGDRVTPGGLQDCFPGEGQPDGIRCEPNYNGFAGGMCSANCAREGAHEHGGVCVRVPHHGFESACFQADSVIEQCLHQRPHFDFQLVAACSRTEACRDDFICARVPGLAGAEGACVPPYFVFQVRVDGPPLDREDSPARANRPPGSGLPIAQVAATPMDGVGVRIVPAGPVTTAQSAIGGTLSPASKALKNERAVPINPP